MGFSRKKKTDKNLKLYISTHHEDQPIKITRQPMEWNTQEKEAYEDYHEMESATRVINEDLELTSTYSH